MGMVTIGPGWCYNPDPNEQDDKEKIDKLDFVEFSHFCSSKSSMWEELKRAS